MIFICLRRRGTCQSRTNVSLRLLQSVPSHSGVPTRQGYPWQAGEQILACLSAPTRKQRDRSLDQMSLLESEGGMLTIQKLRAKYAYLV